jgi:hypothetical protein
MFLQKGSDLSGNGNLYWESISNVTLTYNGEIFYRADGNTNALWSLVSDTKSASVNTFVNSAGSWTTGFASTWVDMPFQQTNVQVDKNILLMHGKPILNAVVNLSLQTPTAAADYTLTVVYLYNSSLLMSRGGAEYIF